MRSLADVDELLGHLFMCTQRLVVSERGDEVGVLGGEESDKYVDDASLVITPRDGDGVVWRGYNRFVSDSESKDVDMAIDSDDELLQTPTPHGHLMSQAPWPGPARGRPWYGMAWSK